MHDIVQSCEELSSSFERFDLYVDRRHQDLHNTACAVDAPQIQKDQSQHQLKMKQSEIPTQLNHGSSNNYCDSLINIDTVYDH